MNDRFAGRTAIVTGASRGIGLAIAERLVADGAKVVITARNKDALDEAVDVLGGPEHALAVAGSADDPGHQADAVGHAVERFGSLDMLVNNAAISMGYGCPMVELAPDAVRKIVEVNCLAALAWVQQAHRAWMKEHGGAIVNVSSVASLRAAPDIGLYGATKAMLTHMTEQLAVELAPDIRVNSIAPAMVKTKFAAPLYEGREAELAERYPLKRLGMPEDIGGVVAFLLSEDAAWMTGQQLVVDGGVMSIGMAG
ncbi:3-oxoacyl-[acyl-carrier protein] reductase [Actinomadura madurae]|uniref:3-oxoacyl-[acyl-carrier protein] reductase n=1 Tax=Actinomadura madurae TaxID=1993 RepID=A0A1I5I578_9ACTN|nr:SDR family oxidoreductase [Actinomadura madurae]SFO55754.1 3-oxoacyl-[acyl-carrier protein] reductase [Actinomadura madurae]